MYIRDARASLIKAGSKAQEHTQWMPDARSQDEALTEGSDQIWKGVDEFREYCKRLEEENRKQKVELEKIRKNIDGTTDSLGVMKEQKTNLQNMNRQLEDDKVKLEGDLAEEKRKLKEKSREVAKLKKDKVKLEGDLAEEKRKMKEKDTEVVDLTKKTEDLSKDKVKLEGDIAKLEGDLAEQKRMLEGDLAVERRNLERNNREVANLREENRELKESCSGCCSIC